ncbi:MAG: hypothetical protein ACREGG_02585 [Candidatus Saccharimonadales bacterium]
MLRRPLGVFLVLAGGLFYVVPTVLADQVSISSTVTLTGIVLPGRYIYLDKSGDIYKVVGNTSQNITPTVLDSNNHIVNLGAKTNQQYQQLLAENGGHLQAGQTYLSDKYNPYILFARWVTNNPYFSQKII